MDENNNNMKKFNDETWLKEAIAYISNEMTDDEVNAFDAKLKENAEVSQRFELLKRIWILDNKNLTKLDNRWNSIKQRIYEDFVLSSYIRKANNEKPDETTASILKNIEIDMPVDKQQKLEKIANSIFPDDENCWIAPKKDIWNEVKRIIFKEIRHSKRKLLLQEKRKPLKNGSLRTNGVKKRKINRSILITGIASVAAVIIIFLVLFVFMPYNSTKFATDDSRDYVIPDEKEIVKILPDVVDIDDSKKDEVIYPEEKPDSEKEIKKNENEIVKNPTDDKKDVVDDNKTDKVENKNNSEVDDEKKPDAVIENKTDKNDEKDNIPEKTDHSEVIKVSETQEFVYGAKYVDFDPEKLKFNMPSDFGIPLTFMFDSVDNKFNSYNFNLPTKDNGFKITVDSKNNLLVDLDNDGVFEKRYSISSYRTYQLDYDNEKPAKLSYRLKFVRDKNNWSIMPASGFVTKKAYMNKPIMLIDANINGMFNDINEDYVQFGNEEIQVLSTMNSANDNWVKILPDATGLSIKILKIVPQNMGLLRIESEYQENVTLKWLSIKGELTSITKSADSINDIMLPIGAYTVIKGIVGDGKSEIEFTGNDNFKFNISQNNATFVKIGGELTMSVAKSSNRDNKMIINRKNIVLMGQNGEIYTKMRLKNSGSRINNNCMELLNIEKSFIKSEDNPNYLRNVNIQSTIGSNLIYVTIPKFKEPGIYLIFLVEEKFSNFLTGKSITSIPIKTNVK